MVTIDINNFAKRYCAPIAELLLAHQAEVASVNLCALYEAAPPPSFDRSKFRAEAAKAGKKSSGSSSDAAPVVIVEPVAPVRPTASTKPAYEGYDLPPAKRQRVAVSGQAVAVEESSAEGYFDIPAFLRRQAD